MPNTMNLLATDAGGGGSWITIILMVLMLVMLYFVIIRPQKKQEKEIQQMLNNLAVGDMITTIGGIIGEVVSIKDDTVLIETSRDRTRLRMLRSAIKCVNSPAETAGDSK